MGYAVDSGHGPASLVAPSLVTALLPPWPPPLRSLSSSTPTMTATRIDCDTSQDGKHRYEIIHFSTAHRLPNPYFLPEYNPNRPGPPPRTIYDVRDEANPDIQYYWASVPPDPYFAPSEKARKEGARTIYDVAGQQYHTVLVAAIPAGNKPSSVNSNVAVKPNTTAPASTNTNRNFTPDRPYSQEASSNIFNLDSNPLWTYSVPQKCTKSTSKEEHPSLLRNATDTSQVREPRENSITGFPLHNSLYRVPRSPLHPQPSWIPSHTRQNTTTVRHSWTSHR